MTSYSATELEMYSELRSSSGVWPEGLLALEVARGVYGNFTDESSVASGYYENLLGRAQEVGAADIDGPELSIDRGILDAYLARLAMSLGLGLDRSPIIPDGDKSSVADTDGHYEDLLRASRKSLDSGLGNAHRRGVFTAFAARLASSLGLMDVLGEPPVLRLLNDDHMLGGK